jgi:hypothetical protein
MVMIDPPSSMSGAAARDCDQRIDAHIQRDAKAFARGVDEVSFEFVGGSVGDGMHQRVQLAVALFECDEEAVDFFVFADVAHVGFRAGEGENQVFGFLLQALVLVGDGELHAGGVQSLSDRPGDRAFIGDSEDDALRPCRSEDMSAPWNGKE